MANEVKIVVKGEADLGAAERAVQAFAGRTRSHLGNMLDFAGGERINQMIDKGIGTIKEGFTWYVKYAESVREMSIRTGQSVEDSARLINAADDVGVSYESLSKAMTVFSKNMTMAQQGEAGFRSGLSNTQKVLQSLGITITDMQGNVRPTKDLIGDLADIFHNMPDGVTKTGIAMQIFGRGGAEMIQFLNQGREGLEEAYAGAQKWGQILSGEDVEAAHQFTLANRELSDSFDSLKIKMGKEALPVITEIAKAFTHGMESGENFKKFMIGAAFAIAAVWMNAMTGVTNAIISVFEIAINFIIDKINGLSDKVRVPDFVPGVGGSRAFPEIGKVDFGRVEGGADPMQAFRKMFPDITQKMKDTTKTGDEMNATFEDTQARMKALQETQKRAIDLLAALEKGEVSLKMARENGLVTETYGANGQLTGMDASKAGALQGYQDIIDARYREAEAAYVLAAAMSEVAFASLDASDAAAELTLKEQENTKAKIDAAMADLFGKGTREQIQMQLQINTLDRAMQQGKVQGRSMEDKPNQQLEALNKNIAAMNRELSSLKAADFNRQRAAENARQPGDKGPLAAGPLDARIKQLEANIARAQLQAGGMNPVGSVADQQLLYMKAQKDQLEAQLKLSQLNSAGRELNIKAHDRTIPTDSEQARKAQELTRMMATTTTDMQTLSRVTGKDLVPSMDAARVQFQKSDAMMMVLSDETLRNRLIPASYDVAGAYDAIVAATKADTSAVEAHTAAMLAAAEKLNNAPVPSGGGGGGGPGPQSIKPPNVGDGGIKPLGQGLGGAWRKFGL